jgi:hypothetical protein
MSQLDTIQLRAMTPEDKMKISIASGVSLTTLRAYLHCVPVTRANKIAIEAAAQRLKIKLIMEQARR